MNGPFRAEALGGENPRPLAAVPPPAWANRTAPSGREDKTTHALDQTILGIGLRELTKARWIALKDTKAIETDAAELQKAIPQANIEALSKKE